METANEVSFSSFLAGVMLTRKFVSNIELATLMAKFEYSYNIDFCNDYSDSDYNNLCNYIRETENGFILRCDYNDIVNINNHVYVVYDFLYNFTNKIVREFFNIPEKNISEIKVLKNKKLI